MTHNPTTGSELIEQLAVAALGLGNKEAWQVIHTRVMQVPGLTTIEQRNSLKRTAWDELKRLRREQRADTAGTVAA